MLSDNRKALVRNNVETFLNGILGTYGAEEYEFALDVFREHDEENWRAAAVKRTAERNRQNGSH